MTTAAVLSVPLVYQSFTSVALREFLGTNVVALIIGLLAAIWIGIQEVRNELGFLWERIKDVMVESAKMEEPVEEENAH